MIKRFIKLLISTGFWMIDRFGQMVLAKFGQNLPGTCVVLCFHAVTFEQRHSFSKQMDWLIRKTKPIRADFEGVIKKGTQHVALTFDDGFVSVIKNALPILAARDIHSTLFIPSGRLGQHPDWCKDEEFEDRSEIIVTADHLRSLNMDLVTVGSHTRTHPNLLLINEEEAGKEICDSKKDLETILARTINLFAFPGGWHNPFLLELAQQANYNRVFTVLPKLAFTRPDEFVTGRVVVSPQDWFWEFKLKAGGAYRWEPAAYALKRKLLSIIKKADSMPMMQKKQLQRFLQKQRKRSV